MSEKLLRLAVGERVEATSLRNVAREIGISPPGVALFLGGTSPRSATLAKLHAWHREHIGPDGMSAVTACATLHLLVGHLPADERLPAIRLILGIISQLHHQQGSSGPPWLAPLCAEFGVGEATTPPGCLAGDGEEKG